MRLPLEVMGVCFRVKDGRREYLMLHRAPEKGGFWQPVTGGVEYGETFDQTLLRELQEEIGLDPLRITPLLEIRQFEDAFKGVPWTITESMFGVELAADAVVTLSDEHTEYRWCGLEEAASLLKYDGNKSSLRFCDAFLASGQHDQTPRLVKER